MRLPRPRRRRDLSRRRLLAAMAVVTLAVLGVLRPGLPAFARVAAPLPDVLIKALSANLAFGRPDPEAATVPVHVGLPPGGSPVVPAGPARPRSPEPIRFPSGLLPRIECPEASPTTFPDEPAGFDADGALAPGRYRYRASGWVEVSPLPRATLGGFVARDVTVGERDAAGAFEFDYARSGLLGVQVETFRVVPGDGLYLTRLQRHGQRELDLHPLEPVKVLALPVASGATAEGVGVDPGSLRVLSVQTTVRGRQRIDACGTVLEGWKVEGTRTVTSPLSFDPADGGQAVTNTQQVESFWLVVAPQLGMLILEDHTEGQGFIGPGLPYSENTTASLATVVPIPIPDSGGDR